MFEVLNLLDSAVTIYKALESGRPLCIGKLGNAELMCLYNYHHALHHGQTKISWSPVVEKEIFINAGVFPKTEQARINFCLEIEKAVEKADLLSPWNNGLGDFEKRFIRSRNKECVFIDLCSIEPYYTGISWTRLLKDKKVLIVSPFVETIKLQYTKKDLIWSNNLLPNFELLTIYHPTSKAVSSYEQNPYVSWINMVQDIQQQIERVNFDIALIGTGASSLPLAAFIKSLGKQAIHLGGPLQILFGIKGKRWNDNRFMGCFFNENWVLPSKKETPDEFDKIEGGCYW